MQTIEAVECDFCHKLHKTNSVDYVIFNGEIWVGKKSARYPEFKEENTIYCKSCLTDAINLKLSGKLY